jgi:uncharacterized OB-fold protein
VSAPAARSAPGEPREDGNPPPERPPFLLDFYPLQEPTQTGLSKFYEALREGRLTTTRCPRDGSIAWPPRTVCPKCHHNALEWIDLPRSGTLYAFSAVLAGAPLGMEADVPFAVGLVDLDGAPLRLFGRLAGRPWSELTIGDHVEFEPFDLPDGRVFYRFRATP